MRERAWLEEEARRLGLTLTDEDLAVIERHLERNRAGIRPLRPQETDGLEPPYVFTPRGTPRPSR